MEVEELIDLWADRLSWLQISQLPICGILKLGNSELCQPSFADKTWLLILDRVHQPPG